jgi:hypothetical protein
MNVAAFCYHDSVFLCAGAAHVGKKGIADVTINESSKVPMESFRRRKLLTIFTHSVNEVEWNQVEQICGD